jgi:hypothetical protein
VALGYIAFWSTLFTALRLWLPQARWRVSKLAPSFIAIFVVLIMISGAGFAVNYMESQPVQSWEPIPKEPIGIPKGANPGRLVWVWNPDATEEELTGYWWNKENNNPEIIDQMFSDGLQNLTGIDNDYDAWDVLFRYFNVVHGKGDVGYQPGEKISIKINMNNGYSGPYTSEYDDVDANPYVVKSLIRQLRDVVGVDEDDITVYDASRKLMNWFYYRAYYEEYPADNLTPEFPDVHFVDMYGGAEGREQVVASDERVYFAAGTCEYRTLPTVVTEADYMINMPITKRHVADRVTLAGKNWFGTWMEDVYSVHNYHTLGFSKMGNPAPQADLVAHERLGGNTLLFIGDGTYACRYGNSDISKFEMYPFNGDWMSSLFFSQDSVALDSVMFDFFMVEGTGGGPSEGAQNYLHQQAQPPENLYDPENDGEFVSESMGVHEHWDTDVEIFSSERYSGVSGNGIDFIPIGKEHAAPGITITTPKERHLYISGKEIRYLNFLPITLILGKIVVETEIGGIAGDIQKVEFYIDGELQETDYDEPYIWTWGNRSFSKHELKATVFFDERLVASDNIIVWKFF